MGQGLGDQIPNGADDPLRGGAGGRVPVQLPHVNQPALPGQGQLDVRAPDVHPAVQPAVGPAGCFMQQIGQAALDCGGGRGCRAIPPGIFQGELKGARSEDPAQAVGHIDGLAVARAVLLLQLEAPGQLHQQLHRLLPAGVQIEGQAGAAEGGQEVEDAGADIFADEPALLPGLPGGQGEGKVPELAAARR